MAVWFPTSKSRESTRFPCIKVACNILLENSWQGLQLWFRPHFHRRSTRKVMTPQSYESPNLGNFETPTWESGDKKPFRCGPMKRRKVYYKGEGGDFPQVRAVVSLVSSSCPWLVLTPKVFQLCTNHFVLVLCRPVWVSKACQIFLVPSQSSSTPLYPSKVLQAKERASTLRSSVVFCSELTFESFKELGARQT